MGAPPPAADATRWRPLRELAPARARAVRAVLFDVDDTVTRQGRLEPEAFAAMWSLREAGLVLAAATGRPLGWADVVARQWPVDVAVGENGAGWSWVDAAGRFHAAHHDPPAARAAATDTLAAVRASVAEAFPEIALANDQGARRCDLAFDVGEEASVPPARRDALLAHLRALGVRVAYSSVHVHAMPGDWDKARGLSRALRESCDLSLDAPDDALFVGDSPNDAAAFAAFSLSVGVANARAHHAALPVAPAYVTEADRGRGFAELARHLLAARGRP